MNIVLKILTLLTSFIPFIIEQIEKKQKEKEQKNAQDYADSVSNDPADMWLRKFNPKGQNDNAGKPNIDLGDDKR